MYPLLAALASLALAGPAVAHGTSNSGTGGSAVGSGVALSEVEQMALPKGAAVYTDASASAGQAVQFVQNGKATGSVTIATGSSASSVTVIAHTACGGSPSISLQVDGVTALASTKVTASGWTAYNANVNLAAGSHTVQLSVGGTSSKGSCLKSLYADDVVFNGGAASAGTPTATLTASPTSVQSGASSSLNWSSTNADSCTAGGAWSGSEPTSGSASTGALSNSGTYTLTCTGAGGSASASVTVSVTASSSGFNGPTVAPGHMVGCTSANANGCNSNGVWFEEGGPLGWGSASAAGLGLFSVDTGQPIGIYVDDTVSCPTMTPQLVAPTSQDSTAGSSVCEQEWVSYYANLSTPPPILYAGVWWDGAQPLVGATATLGEMYTQTRQTACTTSGCGMFACNPNAGYGYIVQRYLDYIDSSSGSSVFYPSGSQYPWFTNLWATAANCGQNNGVVAWY